LTLSINSILQNLRDEFSIGKFRESLFREHCEFLGEKAKEPKFFIFLKSSTTLHHGWMIQA
jgi:hypothetical protein